MTIKSDRWIRRMALEHQMIQPFEPEQVREGAAGRVISYGTSSYGYDVRCADEFKIFTNINSAIVDPKHFDSSSFVDLKSDVCIIPPNSFALARTVEYFRIPRNVMTICLGKCLTADTRVVDAESGAYLPIIDFAFARKTLGMRDWRLQAAPVGAFLAQGVKPVYELRTQSGLRIRATATHPFRQLQGWTQLRDLKPGDRIAVAREIPVFGKTPLPDWKAILLGLMISQALSLSRRPFIASRFEGRSLKSPLAPLFQRGESENLTLGAEDPVLDGLVRRCIQDAGVKLDAAELDLSVEHHCVPQMIFKSPQETTQRFLRALFSGGGDIECSENMPMVEYRSQSRRLIEDVRHLLLRFRIFALIRETMTTSGVCVYALQIADREQIQCFAREIGFWPESIKQLRLERQMRSSMATVKSVESRIQTAALGAARPSSSQRSPICEDSSHDLVASTASNDGPVWDVVVDIKPAGEEAVFDLSVPNLHNFVANDMIVHNSTYARCGLIVNVTPLEPEWEGHVTLEFSNTTPLPARIYANEGVAQILFLESDEVCERSYKDRGGKYQGQRGVTLPKP